jgi:hypothetical protein
MDFLGVKGNLHSPRHGWAKGRRQTLIRYLVQPAGGVNARLPNKSLDPLAERQATHRRNKRILFSPRAWCALLTFETLQRFGGG